MKEQYLTEEFFKSYIERYGVPQHIADARRKRSQEIAEEFSATITDEMIAETECFTYDVRDFEHYNHEPAFAASMMFLGKRFSHTEDIEVRYTKIEDKETGQIYPTFTIRNLPLIEQHKKEEEERKQRDAEEKKRLEAERRKAESLAKQKEQKS